MTAPNPSRRNFLRGKFAETDAAILRPPGATAFFDQKCTECGKCSDACPENIIVIGNDRRPVVNFEIGACTFCSACADICPTEALDPARVPDWDWKAEVGDSCLSHQGITCRACEDVCEPRAIRFRLSTGGKSHPVFDISQCTGCGECAYSCPARAISFAKME
ncbi:ferredoxin-type protein NapF [Roseibium sp.]|uniref:ferredoxin-type protein NapF n=1 Tax=Roseibium sp. TaxID=1936156 RepID=UPI003B516AF9